MFNTFMDDCIHLHACRLLAKRYRDAGARHVARFCNDECVAYQKAIQIEAVTPDSACHTARVQYDGNSDPGDVYCPWDFESETAYVIVNGDFCDDEYEDGPDGYVISK